MSWTKRQFVTQAFEEIGLAAYVFDLQPEQMDSARIKLDAMMASWASNGVSLNYPLPQNQDGGDLDDDTGVPDFANETIYLNLALKLAPSYGKQISNLTMISAKNAYDQLVRSQITVPEMRLPDTMPLGQGNKCYGDDNFVSSTQDNAILPPDSTAEFLNGY